MSVSTPASGSKTQQQFVIQGGYPIAGTMRSYGNKNAALPIVAGCLLASEPVILHNVPDIVDVLLLLELLETTGCKVDRARY